MILTTYSHDFTHQKGVIDSKQTLYPFHIIPLL